MINRYLLFCSGGNYKSQWLICLARYYQKKTAKPAEMIGKLVSLCHQSHYMDAVRAFPPVSSSQSGAMEIGRVHDTECRMQIEEDRNHDAERRSATSRGALEIPNATLVLFSIALVALHPTKTDLPLLLSCVSGPREREREEESSASPRADSPIISGRTPVFAQANQGSQRW